MKVLDLFSGIGGFSLGLERAGFETIAFCEQEKHAQAILKKHWPNVPIFDDVRLLDGTQFRGAVDVVCGGFPCQDLSKAGKKAGIEGERSSLYREMLRIISECLPKYAIFENVAALITGEQGRWFAQFLYDLAAIGYDAEWHCISASEIGANHHRDRVWVIAYPNNNGQPTPQERQSIPKRNGGDKEGTKPACKLEGLPFQGILTDAKMQRCERFAKIAHNLKQQIESMRRLEIERRRQDLSSPELCGADDGIPQRLDRIKRLGNAVVPQIPEAIGRAIMEIDMAKVVINGVEYVPKGETPALTDERLKACLEALTEMRYFNEKHKMNRLAWNAINALAPELAKLDELEAYERIHGLSGDAHC